MRPQIRIRLVIDSKLYRDGEAAVEKAIRAARERAHTMARMHGFKPIVYAEHFARWYGTRIVDPNAETNARVDGWRPVLAEGGECEFVAIAIEGDREVVK